MDFFSVNSLFFLDYGLCRFLASKIRTDFENFESREVTFQTWLKSSFFLVFDEKVSIRFNFYRRELNRRNSELSNEVSLTSRDESRGFQTFLKFVFHIFCTSSLKESSFVCFFFHKKASISFIFYFYGFYGRALNRRDSGIFNEDLEQQCK